MLAQLTTILLGLSLLPLFGMILSPRFCRHTVAIPTFGALAIGLVMATVVKLTAGQPPSIAEFVMLVGAGSAGGMTRFSWLTRP